MITIPNNIATEVIYTADGTQRVYSVPFEYLSRNHVHIYLNDVEISAYEYTSLYSITLTTVPASGTLIKIKRITPFDEAWVTWQDGSVLLADDLNAQAMHVLFLLQENNTDIDTLKLFVDNHLTEIIATKNAAVTAKDQAVAAAIAAEDAQEAAETAKTQAETIKTETQAIKDTTIAAIDEALPDIQAAQTAGVGAVQAAQAAGVEAVEGAQETGVEAVQAAQTTAEAAVAGAVEDAQEAAQLSQAWATKDDTVLGSLKSAKQYAMEAFQAAQEAANAFRQWIMLAYVGTKVSDTVFSVAGDKTPDFNFERSVRFNNNNNNNNNIVSHVQSATYDSTADATQITLSDAVVPEEITLIDVGAIYSTSAVPKNTAIENLIASLSEKFNTDGQALDAAQLGGQSPVHYDCGGSCSWTCMAGCTGGCENSCTGSCMAGCTGGCSSCTGTCSGTCSSCTGSCVGGCTSCTSCTGTCTDACTSCTSCTSCSGTCAGTCSSCSGSCVGGCTGCSTTCTGTCSGCSGTCTGTCDTGCTGCGGRD